MFSKKGWEAAGPMARALQVALGVGALSLAPAWGCGAFCAMLAAMPVYWWFGMLIDGWSDDNVHYTWAVYGVTALQPFAMLLAPGPGSDEATAVLVLQGGVFAYTGALITIHLIRLIREHYKTEDRIANFYEGKGFSEAEHDWSDAWEEGEGAADDDMPELPRGKREGEGE